MCGISGLANWGDAETLARMTQVQTHRGPDDSGLWERRFPDGSYIGLGSRRLAILDLSPGGHMPMSNEDGSVWITYNGEIYNFADLRRELEGKGHRFRSHTDTEVVVHLYEEYGVRLPEPAQRHVCVCHLRFARRLAEVASGPRPFRDQAPLLLRSRRETRLRLRGQGAARSAGNRSEHGPQCARPVSDVPLGARSARPCSRAFASWRRDITPSGRAANSKIEQYWDLTFPPAGHRFERRQSELAQEIRERFCTSVEQQMVSDVPIGAFLSAGLDSSSIVAAMAKKQPVRTYTITFPEKYRVGETTIDDPAVPARLARKLGCEHHEIVVEPDVVGLLPNLTWHMDEPTADPAIIAAYLVCREARKQATVLLSGVGGDELFAGYRKHAAHAWAEEYRRLPGFARSAAERALLGLPSLRGTRMKGPVRLAKKMARSAPLSPAEAFIRNGTYLDAEQRAELYAPEMQPLSNGDPAARHRAAFDKVRHAGFLNQMLYLDTKIFMTTLNLTYNDKMSMASSVEVRVPFLNRELAEFVAWNVRPEWKLKGKWRPVTKYIFREAMRSMLPEEVLRQPKAGFAAPVDYWLAHDLRPMVDDLLSENQVRRRGLFRPEVVRRYVDEHRRGAEDWSMQIWQLLTLEIWMQLFLDGGARSFAQQKIGAPQVVTA